MSNAQAGEDCTVAGNARLGVEHGEGLGETVIDDRTTIRVNTILYADLSISDDFATGHAARVSPR